MGVLFVSFLSLSSNGQIITECIIVWDQNLANKTIEKLGGTYNSEALLRNSYAQIFIISTIFLFLFRLYIHNLTTVALIVPAIFTKSFLDTEFRPYLRNNWNDFGKSNITNFNYILQSNKIYRNRFRHREIVLCFKSLHYMVVSYESNYHQRKISLYSYQFTIFIRISGPFNFVKFYGLRSAIIPPWYFIYKYILWHWLS